MPRFQCIVQVAGWVILVTQCYSRVCGTNDSHCLRQKYLQPCWPAELCNDKRRRAS